MRGGAIVAALAASRLACRDPVQQPFAQGSIWNTPIGSGAEFQPAGVFAPGRIQPEQFHHDDDHVWLKLSADDPETPWFAQGSWGLPHREYCEVSGKFYRNISFPRDLTLTLFGHNNGAGLLLPSGEEYIETQPVYRCSPGSPFLSHRPFCKPPQAAQPNCTMSIRGNGTYGAHGGSGLSAVGGAIRANEIGPDAPPISHALKIELSALDYYYDQPPAMVWPALGHDGYAFNKSNPLHYGGSNPNFAPGALLAVPLEHSRDVTVTTAPGRRILQALTQFGGYIVDDTADQRRGTICTQYGFGDAFMSAYGFQFNATGTPFVADMTNIFRALHIVTNNGPGSVGGGGTPVVAPPPPLCPRGMEPKVLQAPAELPRDRGSETATGRPAAALSDGFGIARGQL